jgi:hypothetical protein
MTVFNHGQLIGASVQPMEREVPGCIARRLKSVVIRNKFDENSARRFCGRVNKIAIPRQASALRPAIRTDQEKQA